MDVSEAPACKPYTNCVAIHYIHSSECRTWQCWIAAEPRWPCLGLRRWMFSERIHTHPLLEVLWQLQNFEMIYKDVWQVICEERGRESVVWRGMDQQYIPMYHIHRLCQYVTGTSQIIQCVSRIKESIALRHHFRTRVAPRLMLSLPIVAVRRQSTGWHSTTP